MGQITIYLDNNIETKMRIAAETQKLSKSRWIANLIQTELQDEWSPEIKKLAGAWQDFPTIVELRASLGQDAPREAF